MSTLVDQARQQLMLTAQWLENGCDPKHAATELRMLADRVQELEGESPPSSVQPEKERRPLSDEQINAIAREVFPPDPIIGDAWPEQWDKEVGIPFARAIEAAALQWAASQQAPSDWASEYAQTIGRIQQPYTLAELREKIDSKEYCAELLLQHAMRLLGASQQEAEGDPLDMPLPCDITVGHVTMSKGVPLRSLVYRMQALYELAQEVFAPPSAQGGADEQR